MLSKKSSSQCICGCDQGICIGCRWTNFTFFISNLVGHPTVLHVTHRVSLFLFTFDLIPRKNALASLS